MPQPVDSADTQPAGTPAANRPCWLPGAHGQPVCIREFHTRPCADCPTPTARMPAADPPEPSTPPAQPPHTAPAAAGPPPGTLDGPGVLGRALLDRRGQAWPWSPDGELRRNFERSAGPVREVLLVDPVALFDGQLAGSPTTDAAEPATSTDAPARSLTPAAGRVLDAAQALAEAFNTYPYPAVAEQEELVRRVAAAVDAYDRPTTGGPDLEPIRLSEGSVEGPATERVSPAILAAMNAPVEASDSSRERDRALREALREDAEADAELRVEEDTEPAPEQPDRVPGWAYAYTVTQGGTNGRLWLACDWCGSTAWSPPVRVGMDLEQLSIAARNHQRVCAQKSRAEPAPEPAGDGPGWQRATIGEIGKVVHGVGVNLAPEKANQVVALLADRDRLARDDRVVAAELVERGRAADTARAELATARATLARFAGSPDVVRAELAKAIEERDLAIAHDRQPYPTADAYERVCATLERKRGELATARRDAAAAFMRWYAEQAINPGECIHRLQLADQIDRGELPVPGSPEPAPAGGEEEVPDGD